MVVQMASTTVPAKSFAHSNRYTVTTLLFYFLSGVTPQTPNAEGIYKKIKSIMEFLWLLFPKAPFVTLSVSGELPTSQLSVAKNPASNSHFTKQNKTTAIIQFLSLFSNGDSPPSYSLLLGNNEVAYTAAITKLDNTKINIFFFIYSIAITIYL